jgi:crossover junction endodeoxyribonuclease RusA
MIEVFIPGAPKPQGSKRHVGRGIMVESCKEVRAWRESMRARLITDDGLPIERFAGAFAATLEFILPRPKATPKRKTPLATKKPDLDKLERAVNDAVKSAGVIVDDSFIVRTIKTKRLAEIGEAPGLRLRLEGAVPDAGTKLIL